MQGVLGGINRQTVKQVRDNQSRSSRSAWWQPSFIRRLRTRKTRTSTRSKPNKDNFLRWSGPFFASPRDELIHYIPALSEYPHELRRVQVRADR